MWDAGRTDRGGESIVDAAKGFHYLVYVSAAVAIPTEAELRMLLLVARRNNRRAEITGLLLYGDGAFIQLIEGDERRVRELYARIAADPRHRRVTTLLEGTVPTRHFPDWRMGFRTIDRDLLVRVPGFTDFMSSKDAVGELWNEPRHAYTLLCSFRDHN